MSTSSAPAGKESAAGVLIISNDIVGAVMAGPGIRYAQLARVLAEHLPTRLAAPALSGDASALTAAIPSRAELVICPELAWEALRPHAKWAAAVLAPADVAARLPALAELEGALVIDGYDPLLAEWLALHAGPDAPGGEADLLRRWEERLCSLYPPYLMGDYYLCASERQRTWWLGQLEAAGRLTPEQYAADPSLRRLVDVAPFGLPAAPPQPGVPVMRRLWPHLPTDATPVLWGGGLWPWLDPVSAVHAVARVRAVRPDVVLLFPGVRHPNPAVAAEMHAPLRRVQAAADELGLTDCGVFFGEWLPYAEWPALLAEVRLALSLHFESLETHLAFRTRVLDYIWAGLPIVATGGDATGDLIARHGLGRIAPAQDVAAVADGMLALLAAPPAAGAFARARAELTWERAAEPLVRFCRQPWRAPDRRHSLAPGAPYEARARAAAAAERSAAEQRAAAAEAEAARLRALVAGYENGKFMRFMRALHGLRARR